MSLDFKRSGRAVFVDRDGTLNMDNGYVTSPEEFRLLPDIPGAIARLNELSIPVILITNQSAIGRGLMTQEDLDRIHRRLAELLHPSGGRIDAIYSCPHRPDMGCTCRKPNIGLLEQAREDFSLNLPHCFFVGDKKSDLEAAMKASIPGILVMSSSYAHEALRAQEGGQVTAVHIAENFQQAVSWIEKQIRMEMGTIPKDGY